MWLESIAEEYPGVNPPTSPCNIVENELLINGRPAGSMVKTQRTTVLASTLKDGSII